MSEAFKVPAPMSEVKRCLKRPLSPKPSTSSAPYEPQPSTSAAPSTSLKPPASSQPSASSLPSTSSKPPASSVPLIPRIHLGPKLSPPNFDQLDPVFNAVFARIAKERIKLISSEPGWGPRAGRRNHWRKIEEAKLVLKFKKAANALKPVLLKEVEKREAQERLITGALEHFANTVNAIAEKFEGKADSEYTRRLNILKQLVLELREKHRAEYPNAGEFLREPAAPEPQYSEEEANRWLCEEAEAAIEAFLTGDKDKETLPNNFKKIVEAFKMA